MIIGLSACEGAAESPAWVGRGPSVDGTGDQVVVYGVGASGSIRDPSLARTTADNRARASVAQQLRDLGLVPEAGGAVTARMQGIQIVDHWIEPHTRQIYALARLDVGPQRPSMSRSSTTGT